MAYDRRLAERIRAAIVGDHVVKEVVMLGGLTFMVNERMAMTVGSQGQLMVRCDPADTAHLLSRIGTDRPQGWGRSIRHGWIAVNADVIGDDAALRFWVEESLRYVTSEG
ncbi:hypothetical protein KEM60_02125 [Austwickia sp. TVS 96-490-7B]|uniref:TfoX/Sxy family protein n=1 Tax=Austwickia sp. TVS 96-490-7B TaxID=2830843 RepID=UPI001C5927E8|nr:TfoX/Sxy family protein [Austwickia sp. TVS 96-490-7B]MBW3085914.1 hypothetical protein [Austwickia sp. TVS 96-490-7B]